MKKHLLLIFLALFSIAAGRMWDYGDTDLYGVGNLTWVDQIDSQSTADACSCPTGTYASCYTGDHASGTGYICYTSGASNKDGTITGATVHSDYGDSGNGVLLDAGGEGITWVNDGNDLADLTVGTACMRFNNRTADVTADNYLFRVYDNDLQDTCYLRAVASSASCQGGEADCYRWRCSIGHGGTATIANAYTEALATEVWQTVCVSWDFVTNEKICVKLGTDDWNEGTDCAALDDNVDSAADYVILGDDLDNGLQDDWWADSLRTSKTYLDNSLINID